MCTSRSLLLLVTSGLTLIPDHLAAPQSGQTSLEMLLNAERVTDENSSNNETSVDIQSRSKRQFDMFANIQHSPEELLWHHARTGEFVPLRLLVDVSKIPVDVQDDGNWTAMMWAARFGHEVVVSFLLERGADVNHQNVNGDTALLWSTGAGHEDIVEILMLHDADPNLAESINGFTPVSVAAAMGREPELRIMDKYGFIDLDHLDFNGRTPLNLAAMTGQASMALLLGYHGNINVAENQGMTPAHWGVNLRDTSTLKAVLLLCPNLDLKDNRGNTPLMVALIVGNTAGAQILNDHLSNPAPVCYIGEDEFPNLEFTFFDCKQMQCMCRGFWRVTGIIDPDCVRPEVRVLAVQEVESSAAGNVTASPVTTEDDDHHHHHEPVTFLPDEGPHHEDGDEHDDDHF